MAEIKPTSFRISEEAAEKFKKFASNNHLNQAEAFDSIINTVEVALAKEQIQGRSTEIETFQSTVNNLVRMFINSLVINQTSEDRIRESLSIEINTKDQTITDLQSERTTLKEKLDKSLIDTKELKEISNKYLKNIEKLEHELESKTHQAENSESQIKTLNGIIDEYKGFKKANVELELVHKELTKVNSELMNEKDKLIGTIKNNEDMISFFKDQLATYKDEISTLNNQAILKEKNNIAAMDKLEDKYSTEIAELNKEHKKTVQDIENKYNIEIEKLKASHKEELDKLIISLKEKSEIELQRKELEIDKLKSQLQN